MAVEGLAEELIRLQQELIKLKTVQPTLSDSAQLYQETYNPGLFIDNSLKTRIHTIRCIPLANADEAIFLPQIQISPVITSGLTEVGAPLSSDPNIIYWSQVGITSEMAANETLAIANPKGVVIYSNVPFMIKTSYVDT